MGTDSKLPEHVQRTLDAFFDTQRARLADMGDDVLPLIAKSQEFLSGGKRLRALFAHAGYDCTVRAIDPGASSNTEQIVSIGAALEMFHAAALVHDDIIDESATRRGNPSVHAAFAAVHRQQNWRNRSEQFGLSAAVLIGDLMQSWADELFGAAMSSLPVSAATAAREYFNTMRVEVGAGQYLDVLEEQLGSLGEETLQLERSTRVLIYKSAKYSVESPLLIGAAAGGASRAQLNALSEFGLPIGIAFQLRDDLLGVFGDAEVTGKPSGDDLRSGKRTVLIALARKRLSSSARSVFDEVLGDPRLTDSQVLMLQNTIRESGAAAEVEEMITHNRDRAIEAVSSAGFDADSVESLVALANRATKRLS